MDYGYEEGKVCLASYEKVLVSIDRSGPSLAKKKKTLLKVSGLSMTSLRTYILSAFIKVPFILRTAELFHATISWNKQN
jgi:hypothetical protein